MHSALIIKGIQLPSRLFPSLNFLRYGEAERADIENREENVRGIPCSIFHGVRGGEALLPLDGYQKQFLTNRILRYFMLQIKP